MPSRSLHQLKLELINSLTSYCAAMTQKALEDQVDPSEVLSELAWLSMWCKTLCDSDDVTRLIATLKCVNYWKESYASRIQ